MARIVISSIGSMGDLYPYIALAYGLRERNHEVEFVVEPLFADQLRAEGFATTLLASDLRTLDPSVVHRLVMDNDPFVSLRILAYDYLGPALQENIGRLRDACQYADILVASVSQVAASAVAELTGIRWLSIALSPTIPSAEVAPTPLPISLPPPLARAVNRALWALGGVAVARASDAPLNAARAAYGLPPRHRLLQDGNLSPSGAAVAFSPSAFPCPAAWPPCCWVTGFLFWDRPTNWQAPPEVEEFFADAQGEPVIAVSSGSMGALVGQAFVPFFATSVAAIHAVGARALVIGAGEAYTPAKPDERTRCVEYVPFSWAYPQCAAVIHHGGAGTLAQSLRAGVPTLIAPWGADQFFHGAILEHLGVGRTLTRKRYTEERVARILGELLTSPDLRQRAETLKAQIAREDGVGVLCDHIEAALAQ